MTTWGYSGRCRRMVKVLKPKGQVKKAEAKGQAGRGLGEEEGPKVSRRASINGRSLRTLSQFYLGEMDLKMRMRQMTIASARSLVEWVATLEILR